jgi:hypothetical protein
MVKYSLDDLKRIQPGWFSPENKRFFNDVSYRVLHDKEGNSYLVRSTYAWTDMFGQPKKLRWRINLITPEGKIGELVDRIFDSIDAVKTWLKD